MFNNELLLFWRYCSNTRKYTDLIFSFFFLNHKHSNYTGAIFALIYQHYQHEIVGIAILGSLL